MSGSIFDWSTTAADNDDADGDVNWKEGQNAKTVNNSGRQMMGRVAEFLADLGGQGTVGGTANAITLTLSSGFTALKSGLVCSLQPTADNTGAVTLNVNSIGAKAIRKFDTTGEVALASGDLQEGGFYLLLYDSGANSAAGAWICLNPTEQFQPLDTALTDIAALTPTDSNFIVGNGTTWVAETGATVRTSLGLGTSAIVNTGTSGAVIPLLNGSNTWSSAQTFSAAATLKSATTVVGTQSTNSLFWQDASANFIASITTNTTVARYASYDSSGTIVTTFDLSRSTAGATVNGTFSASGDITYSSDIALKENIVPIEGALDRVKALGGYLYDRKDSGKHSAGLIAQEVERVLPEAVHTDERGLKAVAAGPLIGLLVQAIKELAK
jgi:hypothetical protein